MSRPFEYFFFNWLPEAVHEFMAGIPIMIFDTIHCMVKPYFFPSVVALDFSLCVGNSINT